MSPQENVLIQITTAANMAGVQEAKAGFLGLTPAVMGAGIAIAGLVLIGKSAVENYKAQEEALLSLTQAVHAHNAQLGKTIPISEEAQNAIVAATDAAANADDALTLAQDSATIAQMNYTEAVHKHGAKSDQAIKASIHLKDANIHLAAAQEKAKDTADDLAVAEAVTATTVKGSIISVDELHARIKEFINTNRRYISNQYDVETAMASIIRAGYGEEEAFQILNDALDLSVIKHEDVTAAEKQVILALAGNKKTLKELGISNDEFDAIMKSKTLTTAEKHAALLKLIETHTKDGKKALDDNKQSQNDLTKSWQDFTEKIGPPLLVMWDQLNAAASTALGILTVYVDLLDKLAKIGPFGGQSGAGAPAPPGTPTSGYRLGVPRHFAAGGSVAPGETVMVGEQGPEPYTAGSTGGYVTPHGGRPEINIHINGGIFMDHGPTIDRLANLIAQRLSFVTGR